MCNKKDGAPHSFLATGDATDDTSAFLDRRKLSPVRHDLMGDYDFVLLDLESIGASIDTFSVGKDLDGILVALREEGSTRNQFDDCLSQLKYASDILLSLICIRRKTFLSALVSKLRWA